MSDSSPIGADSFGVQLEETLRHFLTLPAEAGEPLTQLESALYDDLYRSWLLEQVESEHVRTFVWRYHQMRDDRKVSLAMPVMNKLSGIFATRKLRAILSDRNPVDLAGHLAQPGSILLVSLAVDETANLGRSFGSMILGCLTQAMFSRVGTAESQRNPVLLVLDEFSHFAGEDISAILAEGRRFRYSAILAHQALCQVSPALRSLVLGNVGLKVVFRLGRDDSGTMSADLTGDRKAIDFTRLPVGTCVIKRGSRELVGVEVNTPIGNGGVLDAGGRQLLAEIHSAHPNIPYSSPCLSLRASAGSTTDPGKKRRGQGPHQPSRANVISLEGWL